MSTLAAARADNFYYPPDHDPSKGGLNKQQGQHPLRERAKKLDQGILVIRFEMPFNVWCGGCNHLIGKGVRFNAEKKQVGNYHSTKIWSFCMKAPCCKQHIEVQTDPQAADYVVVSGGRKKVEDYTSEDAQTLHLRDAAEKAQLDDPLARLEHDEHAKAVAREDAIRMSQLRESSEARWKNDYENNKNLRRRLRVVRKADKERDEQRKALGLPDAVQLLPLSPADSQAAALTVFGDPHAHESNWRRKRKDIQSQSIFARPSLQTGTSAGGGAHRSPTVAHRPKRKGPSELAAAMVKRQRMAA